MCWAFLSLLMDCPQSLDSAGSQTAFHFHLLLSLL